MHVKSRRVGTHTALSHHDSHAPWNPNTGRRSTKSGRCEYGVRGGIELVSTPVQVP